MQAPEDPDVIWLILPGAPVDAAGQPRAPLADRIAAALRWHTRFGGRILVSGTPDETAATVRILREAGLTPDDITEDAASRRTADTVRTAVLTIPPEARLWACTQAWHMPRLQALFRAAGRSVRPWTARTRPTPGLLRMPFRECFSLIRALSDLRSFRKGRTSR